MPMGALGIRNHFRDIGPFLIHRCWIERGSHGEAGLDHDEWGEPIPETTPSIIEAKCRIEHRMRWVGRVAGQDIVGNTRVFFASPHHPDGVEIGPEDRIIFDDPDDVDATDVKRYVILRRERYDGWSWEEDLGAHWEVFLA